MMDKNKNFYGIDALRGVLSVLVCVAHSWQIFIMPIDGLNTTIGDFLGLLARFSVICFFCLSGYVISLSISRNMESNNRFSLKPYLASRAYRILPPLLFVILVTYFLAIVASWLGTNTLPNGISGARPEFVTKFTDQIKCIATLCVKSDLTGELNGPLWSLKYEIQLYTITGLLASIFLAKNGVFLRIISALALLGYLYLSFRLKNAEGGMDMQIVWFVLFLLGVLGFLFGAKLSGIVIGAITMFGFTVWLAIFINYDHSRMVSEMDVSRRLIAAQVFFGFACVGFIVYMTKVRLPRYVAYLGKFSYSLYIIHFPILLFSYFLIVNWLPRYSLGVGWVVSVTGVLLCMFLAYLMSNVLENPLTMRQMVRKIFTLSVARA